MKIKIPKITCKRCGYTWAPRQTNVRRCPNCSSIDFDKPKEVK